jgi:hypothetical protein
MLSYSIIEDLWCENRTFCSSDYDKCIAYLSEVLPFKIHRFEQTDPPPNGWAIPPKWDVEKVICSPKMDPGVMLVRCPNRT